MLLSLHDFDRKGFAIHFIYCILEKERFTFFALKGPLQKNQTKKFTSVYCCTLVKRPITSDVFSPMPLAIIAKPSTPMPFKVNKERFLKLFFTWLLLFFANLPPPVQTEQRKDI